MSDPKIQLTKHTSRVHAIWTGRMSEFCDQSLAFFNELNFHDLNRFEDALDPWSELFQDYLSMNIRNILI
jgi:uncharacterized damage-inducible protein DinB